VGDLSAAQQVAGWAHYVRIGAAGIGNLGATWARKSLSVSGYVRNVTNNQYVTRVQLESSPPLAPLFQQTLNAPRTYGVVLNVSF
jgi:iron complex outermembrane receptor protein